MDVVGCCDGVDDGMDDGMDDDGRDVDGI